MSNLIPLRESAATADGDALHEPFTPLVERAMRPDGTIGIRIIGPGWGSSGYYSREVLQRDIPKIFPPGTQMFWNHATPTEEAERPEGDLNHLAGVTVSAPYWLDSGPKGAGMYADARPFTRHALAIDEIGEHIGVSIRALGRHTLGEAEGRQGRIIQELVAGKSIDYVTVPGAGGAIVKVFESAGADRLPAPEIAAFLSEAGRVLSQANEKKLRTALEQLASVLSLLSSGSDEEKSEAENTQPEVDMELEEALAALEEAQKGITDRDAAVTRLQEQLLLREARDFVDGTLAAAELPDVTKARLGRQLAADPPVKDGRVDEAALTQRIETAVTEAQAEIAAIAGQNGKIFGMGNPPTPGKSELPELAESRKRTDVALARLGGM